MAASDNRLCVIFIGGDMEAAGVRQILDSIGDK
jgi:hypothetical protein